ncbi:hypothetical protein JTE90_012728 [Oedothorax gibbosus]|uniref:Uncharacterized protein n=1 Tax=Oedothorax gibbosus TaxID=931172 RepID=A0AAV6W150_9ARAC|nr:hypothetical protein JTE90_012728 [Oedothorax gibbosus]
MPKFPLSKANFSSDKSGQNYLPCRIDTGLRSRKHTHVVRPEESVFNKVRPESGTRVLESDGTERDAIPHETLKKLLKNFADLEIFR